METLSNKNLSNYVTMKLGGQAKEIVIAYTENDVVESFEYAQKNNMKIITIGDGTNVIFSDQGFDGLVILNRVKGLSIDTNSGLVTVASGGKWDDVVQRSIELGLCGIEAMTAIPGTVGASPINNIGAYGQELSDNLLSVRAYDTQTKIFVEISNGDCAFDYRNSRFKSTDYGRFIICGITLQLKKTPDDYQAPSYPSLAEELNNRGITRPTPSDVRQALFTVRNSKLPNPADLPNSGSFFKNPVVSTDRANEILKQYPDMPNWPLTNTGYVKLSAGWLIENAGLKGYRQGGIWIYDKQALVLVNESAKRFKDLWYMTEHIIKVVDQKYKVVLEPEPEII